MDKDIERNLDDLIEQFKKLSIEDVDIAKKDPVIKMMLAALLCETQKIQESLDLLPSRIADHFCEDFIPRRNVRAIPAIAIVEPIFKKERMGGSAAISENAVFVYKPQKNGCRPLNFIPLFKNEILPVKNLYWLSKGGFHLPPNNSRPVSLPAECRNVVWVGLNVGTDVDCVKGFSILLKNTKGLEPVKISIEGDGRELEFATLNQMERIEMLEPFDSQQATGYMLSVFREWKSALRDTQDVSLIYLTDPIKDRDLFKPKPFPSIFQFCLLSEELDSIQDGTIWLKIEFPVGTCISDGEKIDVKVNAFPVVNIEVDQVTLTAANPIAKLQKQDDVFFMDVIRASNQSRKDGFDIEEDEYLIRDFDASCYNDGDLYRDARYLYHQFVENFYAFMGYNAIKDGEVINQLRQSFNTIGKSVGTKNSKYQFDSGVYAMRNINRNPQPSSTKVAFMTTRGLIGNQPHRGDTMENKKHPAFNKELNVVVSACCGRDTSSADERYEQMRYFTLTHDRLYTKMDIDAFMRKEIMAEFGSEEFQRINVIVSIEGAGGKVSLQRGLYIDIEFKDKKNYDIAVASGFGSRMQHKITDKSCLSMPVIVGLKNLEV